MSGNKCAVQLNKFTHVFTCRCLWKLPSLLAALVVMALIKAPICRNFVIKFPKITCTVWYISSSCVLTISQKSPKIFYFREIPILNNWPSRKKYVASQWRNVRSILFFRCRPCDVPPHRNITWSNAEVVVML